MFRSSSIIRELALNLAKVKTFGEITSLYIMRLCGSMLLHNRIINNDVISPNVLKKYKFSQVQCKLPDDGRRPKHVGAIFMFFLNVNFNVFFKLIKVHLLVSELYRGKVFTARYGLYLYTFLALTQNCDKRL